MVAASTHPSAGRTQRRRDPRRRPRLRGPRVLRVRDPDTQPRRARRRRCPLHELPRDADVLADACGAPHGGQQPPRRRRPRRALRPRFPRLRDGPRGQRRDRRRDVPRQRLRHSHGRQVAPDEGLVRSPTRARATRGPASAVSTASTGSSTASRTSTSLTGSTRTTTSSRSTATPTTTTSPTTSPTAPISMIRGVKAADPTKPFFCYVAHGACHAPLQARGVDIEAHRGRYDGGLGRTARRAVPAPAASSASSSRAPGSPPATPRSNTTSSPGTSSTRGSRSCSPATWRSTRRWSTASTRASAG